MACNFPSVSALVLTARIEVGQLADTASHPYSVRMLLGKRDLLGDGPQSMYKRGGLNQTDARP